MQNNTAYQKTIKTKTNKPQREVIGQYKGKTWQRHDKTQRFQPNA